MNHVSTNVELSRILPRVSSACKHPASVNIASFYINSILIGGVCQKAEPLLGHNGEGENDPQHQEETHL